MGTSAGGRWMCGQCGANNFDTVTHCWKCGTARAGMSPMPSQQQFRAGERSAVATAPASLALPAIAGDARVAKRAAILLALTIPFLGLPVGWIFMMMEDYRRQAIGRFCVLWSCIGLILHFFVGMFLLQATTAVAVRYLLPMVQQMQQMQGTGGRGGQGLDMPNGLGGSGN